MMEPLIEPVGLIECHNHVSVVVIEGIPIIKPGDDLGEILITHLNGGNHNLRDGDVLALPSKLFSRCENQFVDLRSVHVSAQAEKLARQVRKDPRLVQLILDESVQISRSAPGVLIVRHRLGHVCANAGIDASNALLQDDDYQEQDFVLLLPKAPNESARQLRAHLESNYGISIGVVITDSLGRPFRLGTVGHALGCSGMPVLWDQVGKPDLFGRSLAHTATALADQIAATADLVLGQGAEGRGAVLVRGLSFTCVEQGADNLHRPLDRDLYA